MITRTTAKQQRETSGFFFKKWWFLYVLPPCRVWFSKSQLVHRLGWRVPPFFPRPTFVRQFNLLFQFAVLRSPNLWSDRIVAMKRIGFECRIFLTCHTPQIVRFLTKSTKVIEIWIFQSFWSDPVYLDRCMNQIGLGI